MIKNVVLDVGRVLVAWKPLDTMRELGFSEEIISCLDAALFKSGVWNEADRGVLSDEDFLTFAIEKAPDYAKEIRLFWSNIEKAIWQLPYAKPWICAMKKAGYQVYILSNYGSYTYEKTKEASLDFLEDADGAIFSYEVKQIKPDAAIFEALFEKYQIKAEESVFLDDLAANVEGAKRVGMHGIVFIGLEAAREELKALGVEFEM